MAIRRWNNKLILLDLEATAGTAVALAAGNAVRASSIELNPVAGDTVSRELELPHFGASQDIPVNVHQTLSFGVELAGPGAAGTAPAWGKMLQACGMSETIVDNASVTYKPVTGGEKSATISLNVDGKLYQLAGCRGTWSLEIPLNGVPRLTFNFTGKYAAPSDTAQTANPDYSAWKVPIAASNEGTPDFELYGVNDLALSTLSLDWGAEVIHRDVINAEPSVEIVGRTPSGSLTIDMPTVAKLSLEEKAKSGDTGALKVVHGSGAGKIIEVECPKIAVNSPSPGESNGIAQTSVNFVPLPNASAGNDEITIVVK